MKNQLSNSDSSGPQSNQDFQNDLENIRIAYQTLPQMIAFEGQKAWNALSVFVQLAFVLAAGAIVPNFLPEANEIIIAIVGFVLSIFGCVATIIWLSFDKRYRKISRYWVLSMRELEEKLSSSVNPYQRGKEFAQGNEVSVSGEKLRYHGIERLFSVQTGFLIIYLVFFAVFISLASYNIYRLLLALNSF
jgi:hypothetical protein